MLINADYNKITELGIRQMVTVQWPQLERLYLCNKYHSSADSNIGSDGAKLLIKVGIKNMK
jgi:hypothetical protein